MTFGASVQQACRLAPTDNMHSESFNGRVRTEGLDVQPFPSLDYARTIIEAWRRNCSVQRPTSALGELRCARLQSALSIV